MKDKKEIIKKIVNVVLWIVLFAWMAVCLVDFFTVKKAKDPKFCVSRKEKTISETRVDSCVGLGYKVYKYTDSEGNYTIEFRPIWSKSKLEK